MTTERSEAVWLDSQALVSIVELAECTGMSTDTLRELVDYGALSPADPDAAEWAFSAECIVSVRAAARVGRDLDLDLDVPVLALVISYLERIHRLEAELRILGAQSGATAR